MATRDDRESINFAHIEKKWQEKWEFDKVFTTPQHPLSEKKCYVLEMFPYPSAAGLHMGHALNYTIGDVYARFKRMNGFQVLYPMGYDAFGLPAENAAIKAGKHPKAYTDNSMKNFIMQQKALGLSYDWNRLVVTCHPEYYKWNQWLFIKLYEKGLVYRKKSAVNWCPQCNTVLANEQVHSGNCWRHTTTEVEVRQLEQWFIKTTAYADELLEKIPELEWPERIKIMQENWIGKSYGTEIKFNIPYQIPKKVTLKNVEEFRKNISLHSKLIIQGKEFTIEQLVKFKFDDGNYYLKLFLNDGYVLADDLGGDSFILVKEVHTQLEITQKEILYEDKSFTFSYNAHAIAEEVYGQEIFKKGESETFWDYTSSDGSYLSLGIIDTTKNRLDFYGKTIYAKDIELLNESEDWTIFTTRPDTIYGVTFMVISAQHARLSELVTPNQKDAVDAFLKKVKSTTVKTASDEEINLLEKEGVFTGSYATHPLTQEKIPVYAGNFVVADYAGGMVMAVPAHDQRDYEFAQKYGIPIKEVIVIPDTKATSNNIVMKRAYTSDGVLINSQEFDGLNNRDAIDKITSHLESLGIGKRVVQYKLRDWLISRQRYWGTPIPMIYCEKCGIVPEEKDKLPVLLPDEVTFGEGNPLASNEQFMRTHCPICNGPARRETDTMDTFFDSSWYYLRYTNNHNTNAPFDPTIAKVWMPVDQYIGGAEHACMHLIYARFFTKALRDMDMINCDEPFTKLFNQGMLHGSDGNKMSKSLGNVVNPIEMIDKYSADALRFNLMSLASPDKDSVWNDRGMESSYKYITRVYTFLSDVALGDATAKMTRKVHKTIKEYTQDISQFRYNVGLIKLRSLLDDMMKEDKLYHEHLIAVIKMISPFCPHLAEELYVKRGGTGYLAQSSWPTYNESLIDRDAEYLDEVIDTAMSDIRAVKELVKVPEIKTLTLIISPRWKYDFFSELKIALLETRNTGELMKKILSGPLKSQGQEITKILPKLVSDPSKIPERILNQERELHAFMESQERIALALNCSADAITIILAEESSEPKAKQASPGKPAILIA